VLREKFNRENSNISYDYKFKYRLPTTKELKLIHNYYRETNVINFIKNESLLGIDLENASKGGKFSLLNLPEFTRRNSKYSNHIDTNKFRNNITIFRCICEREKVED